MSESALDEFRQLVLKVRRESIANVSGYLTGHSRGERAKAMAAYEKLKAVPEVLEGYFLPEIVDEVLIILLQTLDESPFDIQHISSESGKSVSLSEKTESLSVEYEFEWLPQVPQVKGQSNP